ncbi:MAG: methionyl-tRNA formyltransferase [Phycisphaeraceae bacterium]|nr:methionyl-tRNA formyltransferase [Phycisphaeraceae bacterium]
MRLVLLGSGEFGLPTFKSMRSVHDVLLVVTQPDRPAGRHRQLTPTPVGQWAVEQGLPVIKPPDVNDPAIVEQIAALRPDAAVVIAFGQKLGPALIAALGRLAVNLHASLLPKYRGAAPINWAILRGETETGVSVISLADRMDAGLIYAQAATPIGPTETAGELHDRLAEMGPAAVGGVLDALTRGSLASHPQDESQTTKAPKLSRADGVVSFAATSEEVCRRIHALTPWPGVEALWMPGRAEGAAAPQHLKLLRAEPYRGPWPLPAVAWGPGTRAASSGSTGVVAGDPEDPLWLRRVAEAKQAEAFAEKSRPLGGGRLVTTLDGAIRLLEVQLPGGRAMKVHEFTLGHDLRPGDRLGQVSA